MALPAKASHGKGGAASAGSGGWDPAVAGAIREIKDQLSWPGSDGRVWIEGWGQRYQESLGTLREFLESRPDKFSVIPGEGKKFTVAIVGGASDAWAGKRKQEVPDGPPAKKAKTAPHAGSLEANAIREINEQLLAAGNQGNVWIAGWGSRYQASLGTLREFLESKPDHFTVIPGEGRKFTVIPLSGKRPKGKSQGKGKSQSKLGALPAPAATGGNEDLEAAAIAEAQQQLSRPNSSGKIWIASWGRRFEPTLGKLRDFLESHSDTFVVVPEDGSKYSVQLVEQM
eukprot:gnl/TRDRNA2_/TRDRNA2_155274_c1_seq1.p1 gnl/TRDRNA2_/TRDRNA2_155274_c1~~gnl/TRDRNA2_/TRDRNA2_155274_c1_seq1.p1  ORF type:complete len:307 (+),score=57.77 gnl/TRDRNA2_/TRDRNA2_155274_c1_seq1:68-922(+)